MNSDNKNDFHKIQHDHAWNYFSLHANQRIVLFRFYILFFTTFVSGVSLIIHFQDKGKIPEATALVISVAFLLVTYVFQGLDKRNVQLISYSESAMRLYENEHRFPEEYKIFNNEESDSKKAYTARHGFLFKIIYLIGYIVSALYIMTALTNMGIIKISLCLLCHR